MNSIPLIRAIGNYRVETLKDNQPDGWTMVRIFNIVGTCYFQGLLQDDELAVELVVQMERARAYDEADARRRIQATE